MTAIRLHHLYYLHQVLGLRDVVMAASDHEVQPILWQTHFVDPCDLLVIGRAGDKSAQPFSGEKGELLKRIVQAMKISWEKVSLLEVPLGSEVDEERLESVMQQLRPQWIVVFGEANLINEPQWAVGQMDLYKNVPCLVTVSLERVLSHPAEKKALWEQLQRLLKFSAH